MTSPISRYPNESALDFANRRLRHEGKTHMRWILRGGHMVLEQVRERQPRLDFTPSNPQGD